MLTDSNYKHYTLHEDMGEMRFFFILSSPGGTRPTYDIENKWNEVEIAETRLFCYPELHFLLSAKKASQISFKHDQVL